MKAVRGVRWREIEKSWMFWVDRFAKAVYVRFKICFRQNLRLVLSFKFCKALLRNKTLKTKYSKGTETLSKWLNLNSNILNLLTLQFLNLVLVKILI